jgi:U3 small nucleolar RNA-associated protein 13
LEPADGRYDERSAALVSVHADQNILFHSLHTLACDRQIVGFNDDIVDAAWLCPASEQPSHVALATNSSLVRVYDIGSLNARLLPGHRDMVLALARSADGKLLVTGSKDRTARIWAPRGEGWACVAVAEGHAEAVGAVAVANKGGFMFTASQDRTIKMWDLAALDVDAEEPAKLRSLATLHIADKDINALDIAPNDRFLVSGSQDKLVKIFEIEHSPSSGSVKHVGTCKGHRRGVWSVRFSRTDRIVASGAADRTIKLWSLDDFSCLKTFEGHTNSVLRVDFMTAGMQLVSAGGDGLVKLWNIKDEACVATLDGHEDKVWALAVSPDENTILSAGSDSLATFWDDSSAAEQEEANAALVAKVQAEQDFTNYVAVGDYRRAIRLALAMGHPGRLLGLFRTVLTAAKPFAYSEEEEEDEVDGRVAEIDAVIGSLGPLDLVRLLKCVRDWNANAKTSGVAQAVLNAVVRLKSPDEIMGAFEKVHAKQAPESDDEDEEGEGEGEKKKRPKAAPTISMRELLDGLVPYSERHMARVDRLVQESYMLDYTISEMDGGMFGTEVMEVDA